MTAEEPSAESPTMQSPTPSHPVDYSLYLVTDNTPAILGDRNLATVVEQAIQGGVTVVQLRDKTNDTAEQINIARRVHAICKLHNVPLIINDRVDVAIAADVEGVHLGQDDMSITTARELFKACGREAIIGVTVSSIDEALIACEKGADYLGIGTVFATPTKENTKSNIGTAGLQQILQAVQESRPHIPTVCIGGINQANAQRVIHQSTAPDGKRLDGIAVVSAIIAAPDPKQAAADLYRLVTTPPPFTTRGPSSPPLTRESIVTQAPAIIKRLAETKPLCHNMTNLVVQNFAANVAICIGGSPIMSTDTSEAPALAALNGSLVINMGTATPAALSAHLAAATAYNAAAGPVLLDPVGAGATPSRAAATATLLGGACFAVVKGNEGEMRVVAGEQGVAQRGVDSGAAALDVPQRAALVRAVARRYRCVAVLTGVRDVLSDGRRTVVVGNGHAYLGDITGSGCTLGTAIAAALAVERGDALLAVVAAVLAFEIAAERAAGREGVRGPGTFVPAFLDELYAVREESLAGDGRWAEGAKVDILG